MTSSSSAWIVFGVLVVAGLVIKGAGPFAMGGRELPPLLARLVAVLPPAVLAALVLTQTFSDERALVLDARAAGLVAAVVAIALRAPVLLVLFVAAGVTALTRLAT